MHGLERLSVEVRPYHQRSRAVGRTSGRACIYVRAPKFLPDKATSCNFWLCAEEIPYWPLLVNVF